MEVEEFPVSIDENESKKRRNIVSPWQNIAEFEEVRDLIFGINSSPNSWKRAVEELKVWINRRRSQCPAAAFATHTLLQVKLNDQEDSQLKENDLQSLYAFALIRFFNFMSSTIQSHTMRSMYKTAIEMGLASFVVDLRHTCAHGTELPELLVLRRVANYCLNWLYEYYWSAQSGKMIDADGQCIKQRGKALKKRAQQVEELLTIFDIAFECHMTGCAVSKDVKSRVKGQRLTKLKAYWKAKNLSNVNDTFDAVIADMVALTKCGTPQKSLAKIFSKEFIKMNYFFNFLENHSIEHELEHVLDAVQNLFRFLAVYNIVESVLYKIFDFAECAKTSIEQRAGASFWANQIIIGFVTFIYCKKKFVSAYDEEIKTKFDHNALNFGKLSQAVRYTYNYCGVNLARTIYFGDSFQRPWVWHFNRHFLEKRIKSINEQTAPVIQSLIPLIKPKMSSEEMETLNKIIAVYLFQNVDTQNDKEESDPSDKIYTLNDVFNANTAMSNGEQNEREGPTQSTTPSWTQLNDDEYDWSKCPIGRLPWQ